jgi:hypothetical protein
MMTALNPDQLLPKEIWDIIYQFTDNHQAIMARTCKTWYLRYKSKCKITVSSILSNMNMLNWALTLQDVPCQMLVYGCIIMENIRYLKYVLKNNRCNNFNYYDIVLYTSFYKQFNVLIFLNDWLYKLYKDAKDEDIKNSLLYLSNYIYNCIKKIENY